MYPVTMGMSPEDFRRFIAFKEQRRIDAQRIAERYQQNARANAAADQNRIAREEAQRRSTAAAITAAAAARAAPVVVRPRLSATAAAFRPAPPPDPVMTAYYDAPEEIRTTLRQSGAFEGEGHLRGCGILRFGDRCYFN